jgi:tripartite-type tricarboxylate transporter receptor subunit TctC
MSVSSLNKARVAVLVLLACASVGVPAQTYPTKQIRVVVPFPAGGGADAAIRTIAPHLSESLGQPLVIENRPGASGNIGTQIVAQSPADGYTLLSTYSAFASNEALQMKVPFSAKDFAPITLLAVTPTLFVVNPAMPVKTLKELIALAKKRPGDITYASVGAGTPPHLSAELFNMMAGIKMTHVPYKGGPPALVAVVSGEAQATFVAVSIALPYVKAGRLRTLAVASSERVKSLPDVPTIDESGLRGYEANAWYALLAPVKTPQPIIARLHREAVKALQRPDVRDSYMVQMNVEPSPSTPEQLAALIRSDIDKWTRVVKATGARGD